MMISSDTYDPETGWDDAHNCVESLREKFIVVADRKDDTSAVFSSECRSEKEALKEFDYCTSKPKIYYNVRMYRTSSEMVYKQ